VLAAEFLGYGIEHGEKQMVNIIINTFTVIGVICTLWWFGALIVGWLVIRGEEWW
jgi:hypothetical protein